MGKKESTDRRLNQACRPSVTPSSLSSLECRRSDARTATNGYVRTCSLNKSAKVVLVRRIDLVFAQRERPSFLPRTDTQALPCNWPPATVLTRTCKRSHSALGVPPLHAVAASTRASFRQRGIQSDR